MKKLITICLMLLIIISLFSCFSNTNPKPSDISTGRTELHGTEKFNSVTEFLTTAPETEKPVEISTAAPTIPVTDKPVVTYNFDVATKIVKLSKDNNLSYKLNIIDDYPGYIYWFLVDDNNRNCDCEWLDWNTNGSIDLKITGLYKGTDTLYIYAIEDDDFDPKNVSEIKSRASAYLTVDIQVTDDSISSNIKSLRLDEKTKTAEVEINALYGNNNDYYLGCNSTDKNVVNVEIVDIKGTTAKIKLTGISDGSAVVSVYYAETGSTIWYTYYEFQVNVDIPPITVTIPDIPITLHEYNYAGTKIEQTYKVTEFYYTYEKSYDGTYKVTLYASGSKSYDYRGSGQSTTAKIGWKLYDDEGYVIDTGTIYSPSVAQGDKWRDATSTIYDLKPGKYKLVLLSSN